jgi:lipid-A-disaccharide synthase
MDRSTALNTPSTSPATPAVSTAPTAPTAPSMAMVVGEASGDLLASLVMPHLKARWPGLHFQGIGGERMVALGFEAWWPAQELAVRGYVEVLRHYRRIVGIRRELARRLLQHPPKLFLGVDAPDFNLNLAKTLKDAGIPSVQFVCPSVWAWRAHRVKTLAQSVDHVLCLFPFEPALLAEHGIQASFVGHPLASTIPLEIDQASARRACKAHMGLADEGADHAPWVALMPGSRQSEIDHLGERFLKAAQIMKAQHPKVQFVLPTLQAHRPRLQAWVDQLGLTACCQIRVGQTHLALAACDVSLIASGTATLEAALFKCPMVIAYHMNALSWQIMKRQKLQPWVGLPNILCREFVVPELLQSQATPQALAQETLAWVEDPARVKRFKSRMNTLHQSLHRNTPELCADVLSRLIPS